MIQKLNLILILIILIEGALQFFLSANYLSIAVTIALVLFIIVISKHYQKKQKKIPLQYITPFIFISIGYILGFSIPHIILNLIFTFHFILLSINLSDFENFTVKLNKTGIDIGINRYSLCFISLLLSIYFAMSGKSSIGHPIIFDCIAFLLIGLNLLLILISNMHIRFKSMQNSFSLFFSSTIIAILILFISGPYVISTFTPNLVLKAIEKNALDSPTPANKPNRNNDSKKDVVGYSDNLKLTKNNNITKNHNVEAFLFCDQEDKVFLKSGKIYLKGASFDTYNRNRWSNYFDNSRWIEDGVNNAIDGVIRVNKLPPKVRPITHSVYLLNGDHGNILALPNIMDIYIDKVLAEDNDTYYLPNQTGNQVRYKVTSGYTTYEDIDKNNLVVGNKKIKRMHALLGDVCSKIKATTDAILKPDMSDVDKIESVLYYFRQNFRYSLVTINSLELDPLENFFYHEKVGHCELYATALAVMLRSAGITSRVCVGYCGGQFNKKLDGYVFFSDEAHAWCEIYFENYGWVVIDATPATSIGSSIEINENSEYEFNEKSFSEFGPNQEKIQKSKLDQGIIGILEVLFFAASKDPMLMINIILLTYPISFFFILGLFKMYRNGKSKEKGEVFSNPDFVKEIYKIFGKKQKGITFFEYLDKLKENKLIQLELDEILNYYYSYSYGKTKRNPDIEKKFLLELAKMEKIVSHKKQPSQRIIKN
jgi:hypothetical protein